MRAAIFVVLLGCASGKDVAPAGSAETPKADQLAMTTAAPTASPTPTPAPAPRAAGDPCEGGQIAQAGDGEVGHGAGVRGADIGTGGGAGGLRGRTAQPEPRVVLGTVKVDGALAQEIVRRIVKQHTPQLRACYEQTLKRNPNVNGLVVVHFEVDGDGNVKTAEVTKGLEGELDACIAARIKSLAFPKPEKGTVDVQLPLNLSQAY